MSSPRPPRGGAALIALLCATPALRKTAAAALAKLVEREQGLRAVARALDVHPDAVTALAELLDVEIQPGRPGPRSP